MRQDRFGNDRAHPQPRIERRVRVLEHRHHLPPIRLQRHGIHRADILPLEPDRAGGYLRALRQDIEDGLADHRLAAAGLANEA